MSNSVFKESSIISSSNINENSSAKETNDSIKFDPDDGDNSITEAKHLVVVCGKNGISVDKKGLEDLMDDRILSTVSVIRLDSSNSTKKDENKKSKRNSNIRRDSNKSDGNDDLLQILEGKNDDDDADRENDATNETERKLVGVTIEEFYSPEEAKKLARDILNCAGISSPLEIRTDLLEFRRFIIQNDHCYTPLVSPTQVKDDSTIIKTEIEATDSETVTSSLRSPSNRIALTKGSSRKSINTNLNEKQFATAVITTGSLADNTSSKVKEETNQSEGGEEEEEEYSEFTESSFSEETDNDRDSDLDYDVNDRGGRKKKASKKKAGKTERKVVKRRQTLNITEKEDSEKKISYCRRLSRQSTESRRPLSSGITASSSNTLPSSLIAPKVPIKVCSISKNQHSKGIHIISQHPTPSEQAEMQKEVEQQPKLIVTDSNRPLLRAVSTPKRKTEGVFTEISTFLTQGSESSKPNLRVTQMKTEKPAKGFMALGEAAAKNQLPAQISIQTHQSSSELAAENDKQLDLIDSIVKDELEKKSSIIVKDTMNEDIPHLVKMLESTEEAVLGKTEELRSAVTGTATTVTSSSTSFTHPVEDIDITNAPLLETAEDDIPEDLLQHVAELIDNKNYQDVFEKAVLSSNPTTTSTVGANTSQSTTPTVTTTARPLLRQQQQKIPNSPSDISQDSSLNQSSSIISLNSSSLTEMKNIPKKEPIEIIRKDGRIIKLPPIEAPTTRAKRRAQTQGNTHETSNTVSLNKNQAGGTNSNVGKTQTPSNSRRNSSAAAAEQKSASNIRKRGSISSSAQSTPKENTEDEDEESDSEDDPNKLWCICRQPHNNRFMICCDVCEDWFHGTCVNITKAMGLEMELKGVEWKCPNCLKQNDEKKSVQSKCNESMNTKKMDSIKQQSDDLKTKTATNKKGQPQTVVGMAPSKRPEQQQQEKKFEISRKKSFNTDLKKAVNDPSQKKITDVFKPTVESPVLQRKSSLLSVLPSETKSAASSAVIDNAAQKSNEQQAKLITIQRKTSSTDSNVRLTKDVQKKTQQQQQENIGNLDESSSSSSVNDASSKKIPTKIRIVSIEKNEKQSVKCDSPKVTTTSADSALLNCVVCKKPVRPNSIYCSDDCIRKHANNSRIIVSKASKAAAAASSTDDDKVKKKIPSSFEEALAKASETTLQIKNKIERVPVFERKSGRILAGSSAPTVANLKKWLQDNPTFEVVQPGSPQALVLERSKQKLKVVTTVTSASTPTTTTTDKSIPKLSPSTPTIPTTPTTISPILSSPITTKIRTALQIDAQPLTSSTPKLKKIIQVVTKTTTLTTESKSNQSKADFSDPKKLLKEKDDKETSKEISATKEKKDEGKEKDEKQKNSKNTIKKQSSVEQAKDLPSTSNDGEPIRLMVKKTLKEQLIGRINEVKDPEAPKLTESEIEEFANETEAEMYKLFNSDVGMKYKAKYRSLIFNIKDRKNETLLQKICSKVIEPKQLVRMQPEEMASQQLAQWRQNENKHQLEMIKKSELDLLSCKKNYVLKTHKGEEVIESKSTDQVSLDITIPVEDVVTVLNSSTVSSTTNETEGKTEITEGGLLSPEIDKGKDGSSYRVSSTHEFSSQDLVVSSVSTPSSGNVITENELREKKKVHSSSDRGGKDRDRDRDRDRHHRQKDKHKHKKRSRSRSRSRDRKHKSPSREEKKSSRTEKDREKERGKEKFDREKTEGKDKSLSSKDRHHENGKDKEKQTTSSTVATNAEKHHNHHYHDSKISSKQSTKQSSLSSGSPNSQTVVKLKDKESKSSNKIKSSNEYSLIDKILESTKTVEEAANIVGTVDEKDKEKEKEKETIKTSSPSLSSATATVTTALTKSSSSTTTITTTTTTTRNSPAHGGHDSDQEPSSTVIIATPPEDQYVRYSSDITTIIWSGSINMIDVATFQIVIQPVSGVFSDLDKDLPLELDVVGRISPETVWEYISKIKKSPNKEIVIVRLVPVCETENLAYTALYTYLDKRKRLGVVKTMSPNLKDFYILPLGTRKKLPQVLQSSTDKSLNDFYDDDLRPDLLMGIIIRIMNKRPGMPVVTSTVSSASVAIPSISAVSRGLHPPTKIRKTDTSVISNHISTLNEDNFTPPNSPKRKLLESSASSSKSILTAGRLPPNSTTADSLDLDVVIPAGKLNKPYNQDDEPYSPGGSSDDDNLGMMSLPSASTIASDTSPDDLKRKMDEINRQIEAQKMEIAGMLNMDQNKSYSAIPPVDLAPALASISIPSNLHQILASIKQTPTPQPVPAPVSSTVLPSLISSSSQPTSNIPSSSSLISSILQNTSSSDEEYVPGPVTAKFNLSDITEQEDKCSTDLSSESQFTHDIDLRVEYPQLSKKPRWDMINNPPPPGLEDEYS